MRLIFLLAAVGSMILVPVGTAAVLAIVPREFRLIPVWFWAVWFPISIWAALEVPRVRRLLPLNRVHQSARYETAALSLALVNVLACFSAVIYLGWWN